MNVNKLDSNMVWTDMDDCDDIDVKTRIIN